MKTTLANENEVQRVWHVLDADGQVQELATAQAMEEHLALSPQPLPRYTRHEPVAGPCGSMTLPPG